MSIWLCFSEVRALIECKDRGSHVYVFQTKSSRGSGIMWSSALWADPRATGATINSDWFVALLILNPFCLSWRVFSSRSKKSNPVWLPAPLVLCARTNASTCMQHTHRLYRFWFACVVTSIFSLSLGFLCQRSAIMLVTLTDIELGFRQRHKVFISPLILKGATVRKHTVPLSLT